MLNPIIVLAVFVQAGLSKGSKLVGAIFGYFITTVILIWGLNTYSKGSAIALFGHRLTQDLFIFACIGWYAYDTWILSKARKETAKEISGVNEDSSGTQETSRERLSNSNRVLPDSSNRLTCNSCGLSIFESDLSTVDLICPSCGKELDFG